MFFFSIPMLVLLLVVLSISLYSLKLLVCKTMHAAAGGNKLPPGRIGWPFIGEGLEFYRAGLKGIPEKFFYDRIKKYSSEIFTTSFIVGEPMTVFCGAAGNRFLFSNERKLVNVWWPPFVDKIFYSSQQSLIEQEEAKKFRKLTNQFHKLVNVGLMDSMTRTHFENSWDNKEVTVYPLIKNYTFSLACGSLLGIDDQARIDELIKPFSMVTVGIISIPIDLPGTPFNRALKASKLIRKELLSIVKQRKMDLTSSSEKNNDAYPKQDLLSQIILFSNDGKDTYKVMNEKEIADKILGLLIGGHDSASVVITSVMKYLAELPDVYNEVLREQIEIAKSKAPGELLNLDDIQQMKYSWNVACEAMRLASPAQGGFRQAITDFTYEGYFIPKGWKLYWSATSTHKNPEYFPDPEKFNPLRFEGNGPTPYTFVPFGGGSRICPGKEYARIKILVFMHHVVRRYKWVKLLFNDEKLTFTPFPIPTKGLPIRLQLRPNE